MPPTNNDTQTYELEGKQYVVPKGTSLDELDQYIQSQNKPTPSPAPADGRVYDKPDTGEFQPLGTKEPFKNQMGDAALGTMIAAPFVDATMPEVGAIPEVGQVAGGIRTVGRMIMHPKDTMGDIIEGVASRFAKPKPETLEPDYAANKIANTRSITREYSPSDRGGPATSSPPVGKPIPGVPKPKPELGTPENPGPMSKLPTRMPKVKPPEPERNPLGLTQEENLARNQRLNRAQLTKNVSPSNRGGLTTGASSRSIGKSVTGQRGESVPAGRSIGAGDLATWSKEDLWSQYMKESQGPNREFAQRLADELARRGEVKAVGSQIK